MLTKLQFSVLRTIFKNSVSAVENSKNIRFEAYLEKLFMKEAWKSNIARKELGSQLEVSYSQIPEWESILSSVKIGEREFADDLASRGLNRFGINTSHVHPYSDIEIQAFILGIPSKEDPKETVAKSYITYGAHWLDDFFDNPDLVANPEILLRNRSDIKIALETMGPVGEIGSLLAAKAQHPEGIYKGIHRMFYGGLVQRSQYLEERKKLIQEYQHIGVKYVNSRIVEDIKTLQPEVYWITNKVVLEFINATENRLDFSVQELWNLMYAPALYFHDTVEEKRIGELNFSDEENPRLNEMVKMIRIGARHLSEFADERFSLRLQQLQFLSKTFQRILPTQIMMEYQSVIHQYK